MSEFAVRKLLYLEENLRSLRALAQEIVESADQLEDDAAEIRASLSPKKTPAPTSAPRPQVSYWKCGFNDASERRRADREHDEGYMNGYRAGVDSLRRAALSLAGQQGQKT